jgi:hypothetical protein
VPELDMVAHLESRLAEFLDYASLGAAYTTNPALATATVASNTAFVLNQALRTGVLFRRNRSDYDSEIDTAWT